MIATPGRRQAAVELFAAVDRFHASALMRDYLGDRFVEMFSIVKRVEQDRYFDGADRLRLVFVKRIATSPSRRTKISGIRVAVQSLFQADINESAGGHNVASAMDLNECLRRAAIAACCFRRWASP